MWISTKSVKKEHEEKLVEIAKKELGDKLSFIGYCFGRFDLIIEFVEKSAKVASFRVCKLQEEFENALKTDCGSNSVCSSLTICNPVGDTVKSEKAIRLYTFLRPKSEGVDFEIVEELIEKLNSEDKDFPLQLFWNTSTYSFLLIVDGDMFSKAFTKMLNFRDKTANYFLDSCTYVGLNLSSDPDEDDEEIMASTFVKLKEGFGRLDLDEAEREIWNPISKRLGWSDVCLFTHDKSLRKIKEHILQLRHKHSEIINTSTLLLPDWEENGK